MLLPENPYAAGRELSGWLRPRLARLAEDAERSRDESGPELVASLRRWLAIEDVAEVFGGPIVPIDDRCCDRCGRDVPEVDEYLRRIVVSVTEWLTAEVWLCCECYLKEYVDKWCICPGHREVV